MTEYHKLYKAHRNEATGLDLSNPQIVPKGPTAPVGEVSGFYYLRSFWDMTGQPEPAHFITATGIANAGVFADALQECGLAIIEEVFSKDDFRKWVVPSGVYIPPNWSNFDFIRSADLSKVLLAFQFMHQVHDKKLTWATFSAESQGKITSLLDTLAARLKAT